MYDNHKLVLLVEMALNKIAVSCIVEDYNQICKRPENIETFIKLFKAINDNFLPISDDEYKQFMNLIRNMLFILNRIKVKEYHQEILKVILLVFDKTDNYLNCNENIRTFNNFFSGISIFVETAIQIHPYCVVEINQILEKVSKIY